MTEAVAVELERVGRVFAGRRGALPVLRGVDLAVGAGEFVAILGPSGCGKSTLLRLIAGLDRPSAGVVRLDGRPVTGLDRRCALVFQEPRLLPWKSVRANVALGARRLGERVPIDGLLERVGLAGFGDAYPHQLSGGMAQRAALARALVGRPRVLLLDEPFAALDALTRLRMQGLLLAACRDLRPTTVLVTHDVDEALALADRVVVLSDRPAAVAASLSLPAPAGERLRERSDPALAGLRARVLGLLGFGPGTAAA